MRWSSFEKSRISAAFHGLRILTTHDNFYNNELLDRLISVYLTYSNTTVVVRESAAFGCKIQV